MLPVAAVEFKSLVGEETGSPRTAESHARTAAVVIISADKSVMQGLCPINSCSSLHDLPPSVSLCVWILHEDNFALLGQLQLNSLNSHAIYPVLKHGFHEQMFFQTTPPQSSGADLVGHGVSTLRCGAGDTSVGEVVGSEEGTSRTFMARVC